jgi:hypothetical protein
VRSDGVGATAGGRRGFIKERAEALLTFLIHVSSARAFPCAPRLRGNLAGKLTPQFLMPLFSRSLSAPALILFISRFDRDAGLVGDFILCR